MTHPTRGITKEYILTSGARATKAQLAAMLAGAEVDGLFVKPLRCEAVDTPDGAALRPTLLRPFSSGPFSSGPTARRCGPRRAARLRDGRSLRSTGGPWGQASPENQRLAIRKIGWIKSLFWPGSDRHEPLLG